jgi:pyridoxine kinase
MSVLSIQSHVVHGYVGNKAAAFPIQLFGIDVDPLNVVNFSNHTGYQQFRGRRTPADDVRALIEGLSVNRFLKNYDALLIGYIGDPDTLRLVEDVRSQIIEARAAASTSSTFYFICDPVLGDNGKLYVSDAAVHVYRDHLCQLAQVVTPNWFEASVLTGVDVTSVETAQLAAQWFHDRGVPRVVIKSFDDTKRTGPGWISFFVSEVTAEAGASSPSAQQHVGHVASHEGHFSGTGDLFAGILTARLLKQHVGTSFHEIVFATMQSMQLVIQATRVAAEKQKKASGVTLLPDDAGKCSSASEFTELQVVQSAGAILHPCLEDKSLVQMERLL